MLYISLVESAIKTSIGCEIVNHNQIQQFCHTLWSNIRHSNSQRQPKARARVRAIAHRFVCLTGISPDIQWYAMICNHITCEPALSLCSPVVWADPALRRDKLAWDIVSQWKRSSIDRSDLCFTALTHNSLPLALPLPPAQELSAKWQVWLVSGESHAWLAC